MLFWSGMMLGLEAAKVVEARLHLFAQGKCTIDECLLMVSEKLGAFEQASTVLAHGGNAVRVIELYRSIVADNVARLKGHEGRVRAG